MAVLSHNELEDKLSLVLVPLLASAGIRIIKPVWSDEYLGQGLLNNLSSIPGITLPSNPADIDSILEQTGGTFATFPESAPFCNAGATDLGPDKLTRFKLHSLFALYAVDWDGVVLDIRIGDYSNQTTKETAQELAMDMKEHFEAAGIGFSFFIGDQNQPLGYAIGPFLEFREALDVLRAEGPSDFTKLAIEQGADLLIHAGRFTDRTQAKFFLKEQLQNGAAWVKFMNIVRALASKAEFPDDLNSFPLAQRHIRIVSSEEGYVQRIAMDRVFDLKHRLLSAYKGAGLLLLKKIGDRTAKNDTLAEAYLPSSWDPQLIRNEIQDIYSICDFPPDFQPLIAEKIKGRFRF